MTRDHVRRMSEAGLSASEIATTLALAKSTVCYHLRRLGVPPDGRYGRRYDWRAVKTFYEEGHTVSECRRRFGFSASAWAEAVARGAVVSRSGGAELELLMRRGGQLSRGSLKRALLREGLKTGDCERCGINTWRESSLSLALHHINGNGSDNRLMNLQLLCPNCHSQTENYGGRNSGKRARAERALIATRTQAAV